MADTVVEETGAGMGGGGTRERSGQSQPRAQAFGTSAGTTSRVLVAGHGLQAHQEA